MSRTFLPSMIERFHSMQARCLSFKRLGNAVVSLLSKNFGYWSKNPGATGLPRENLRPMRKPRTRALWRDFARNSESSMVMADNMRILPANVLKVAAYYHNEGELQVLRV